MREKPEPKAALERLVRRIPLRLRVTSTSDVACLQAALGLPKQDLCHDLRTLRRNKTDPGRLKFQESMGKTMQEKKSWTVTWRAGGTGTYTLKEAAAIVKRPYHSLRCLISRGRGVWNGVVDDQLVTVTHTLR